MLGCCLDQDICPVQDSNVTSANRDNSLSLYLKNSTYKWDYFP